MSTNQATQTQSTDPMWLEIQHLRNMVEKQRASSRRWRAAGLGCLAVGVMAGAGFQEQKDLFADTITAKRILLKDDAGAVRLDLNAQDDKGVAKLVINGGKANTKRIMLHADKEESASITAWDSTMIARADSNSGRANWYVTGNSEGSSSMRFNSDTTEKPRARLSMGAYGLTASSNDGHEMMATNSGINVKNATSSSRLDPGGMAATDKHGEQTLYRAGILIFDDKKGNQSNMDASGFRCENTASKQQTVVYSWGTIVRNRFGHSAWLSTRDSGEIGLTLRNGKLTTGGFVTSPKARVFFGISGNGDKPNFYLHTDQNAAFSWYREKSPLEQAKEVWDGIQMIRDAGEMLGGPKK